MGNYTDITLVAVNWNQLDCVKLLLSSYIRHHYDGVPLRLMLYDNGSTDGSKQWLNENEIPFFDGYSNVGHENALNIIYNDIKTNKIILNDTDVEYKANVYGYLDEMKGSCISVGELIDGNYINNDKVKDRISPWFWMFDLNEMRRGGIRYFRDPSVEDWSYDVGSWQWEQMKNLGFTNFNLKRGAGHQDHDLISMRYEVADHIGKVSWNLKNHGDRYSEVMQRRDYVKERLLFYQDIDLKGKFI